MMWEANEYGLSLNTTDYLLDMFWEHKDVPEEKKRIRVFQLGEDFLILPLPSNWGI